MKHNTKPKLFGCFCQLFVAVLVVVWLLAIVKIFVIDAEELVVTVAPSGLTSSSVKVALFKPYQPNDVEIEFKLNNNIVDSKSLPEHEYHLQMPRFSEWTQQQQAKQGLTHNAAPDAVAPVAPPVEVIAPPPIVEAPHALPNPMDLPPVAPPVAEGEGVQLPPWELPWPPVQVDQVTIPDREGAEEMSLTGMKVPRFWEPKIDPQNPDKSMYELGTYVNGQPTIYLMIASYRDFQCRETITSAYMRSDHPERLFVGAVDQVVPGDIGCLDIDIPCSQDPTQMICLYKDQISVYKMDAQYATGPVSARHIGDRMYRGQYFVMQMDAHCLFINHWDTKLIGQWRATRNEMAVLSSYLTDVQGSISPTGDSNRKTRPIMCNSDYEGLMPQRYLRHGSQPEDFSAIADSPQLQPFWAAGFSFSRGHFKVQVPYDAFQPMVFQGEEIAIGIRGFTYGYDFYAPKDSVVFHEYAERSSRRKKIHMFWENSEKHKGEAQKSLKRALAVIGMAPDLDPSTWDHRQINKYGIGKARPLEQFYELFLINPVKRKAVQLCPFVNSGIMHRQFVPHLRPNGMGIDYNAPAIKNYDTVTVLNNKLRSMNRPSIVSPFADEP
jgi:hypothetical protein